MLILNSRASFPALTESGNGISNLLVRDGIADLPERSLRRLLAVSHIVSLSASLGIQVNGLDIIRVR